MPEVKQADGVFEGGGVKGIGLVGAVAAVENAGYQWGNLAGTSAGSIVAALLAVGYTGAELKGILQSLDYNNFKDEGLLDKLGVFGKALSVGFEYGIYEGEYFEHWMENLLRAKGKTKFKDVKLDVSQEEPKNREKYQYKVQAIATDITDQRLLILPRDLKDFGYDPDEFSIAGAVRMSMSIPFFFEPVKLKDTSGRVHFIVDGGVLSNYPIWLLDDGGPAPAWPTFGFKLMERDKRELKPGSWNPIKNPLVFLKAIVGTMMDAHDNYHISMDKGDYQRTIGIETVVKTKAGEVEIGTTDFDITKEESEALYQNGERVGTDFVAKWDFEKWKKDYRAKI